MLQLGAGGRSLRAQEPPLTSRTLPVGVLSGRRAVEVQTAGPAPRHGPPPRRGEGEALEGADGAPRCRP